MRKHHASNTLQALHDMFNIQLARQPPQAVATISVLLMKQCMDTALNSLSASFSKPAKCVKHAPSTKSVSNTTKQLSKLAYTALSSCCNTATREI